MKPSIAFGLVAARKDLLPMANDDQKDEEKAAQEKADFVEHEIQSGTPPDEAKELADQKEAETEADKN